MDEAGREQATYRWLDAESDAGAIEETLIMLLEWGRRQLKCLMCAFVSAL